jgi:hypothetical protein
MTLAPLSLRRSLWPLLRRAIAKALRWGVVFAALSRLF